MNGNSVVTEIVELGLDTSAMMHRKMEKHIDSTIALIRKELKSEIIEILIAYKSVGIAISSSYDDYHSGMANTAAAIIEEIQKLQ